MSGGIQCLYLSPLFVHSYPRHPLAPNPGRLQARLRRSPEFYYVGEDCPS